MPRLSLLLALAALPAWAQTEIKVSADPGKPVSLLFQYKASLAPALTGRPYSATQVLEETLANGARRDISLKQLHRDSSGRTRVEYPRWVMEMHQNFPVIEILDPVAGYWYVLDPAHRTAHRMAVSLATRPVPQDRRVCREGAPSTSVLRDGTQGAYQDLGSRMFDGVEACGNRVTLTYPAGSRMGNDRPVSSTSETWAAWDELGQIVLSTHTGLGADQIRGRLQNLRLEEQDAALFRPPEGYQVVDEAGAFAIPLDQARPAKVGPPPKVTALTGMPYTAEHWSERAETQPDGQPYSTSRRVQIVYRDIWGRTRNDRCFGDSVDRIEITDAVAGYRYVLDPQAMTAVRTPIEVYSGLAARAVALSWPGYEQLGTQTMDGMLTYGVRHTATVEGFRYVRESWFSPQLGEALMGKQSDPVGGDSRSSLKNLKFGEPDAALFRVPEGYRVVDDPLVAAR